MPKLELPAPEKTPRFELGPGIRDRDVSLVTLYGALYCVVNYTYDYSGYIALYLVTKTAVTRTHTLSQHTTNTGGGLHVLTSVVDNLLYAHCMQSQTTLVFDILHRSSATSAAMHAVVDHIEPVAAACALVLDEPAAAPHNPSNSTAADAATVTLPLPPAPAPTPATDEEDPGWAVVGDSHGTPASLPTPPVSPASNPTPTSPTMPTTAVVTAATTNVYDPAVYTFLAPLWLWNARTGTLRRIKANLPAIAHSMHDHKQCIAFLCRRGQAIRAPRPVYSSYLESDDSLEAKQLILQRCSAVLQARAGLSWLEVVFKVVGTPYANECARISAARQSASPASSSREPRERKTSSSRRISLGGMAALGLHGSSGGGSGGGGSSSSGGSGSSKHRDSFDKPVEMDQDNVVARGLNAINNVVSDARESLAVYYASLAAGAPADIEPLEPAHLLYNLLPDITTVGQQRGHGGLTTSRHGNSLGPYGSSPALPLVLRRDSEGSLVVTQAELLTHVWIPLVLQAVTEASVEYFSWALSSYIAVQRGIGATVHPAVSMLLLKLLSARGKYMEVARLLQLQFFPDASEVAMTALEISDVVDDLVSSPAPTTTVPSALVLKSAVSLLQQVGLDMLWRLRERPVAVRWLLGHGRVVEAILLCRKKRGQWREGLGPGSVPGAEIFAAALEAVQATVDGGSDGDESDEGLARDEYVMRPGDRVELLYTVFRFLKEWDPAALAVEVS